MPEQQTMIEGTHDAIPDALEVLAQQYTEVLRARMLMQKEEAELRQKLADGMAEHDLDRIELAGDIVTREHVEKETIAVKKKPTMDDG